MKNFVSLVRFSALIFGLGILAANLHAVASAQESEAVTVMRSAKMIYIRIQSNYCNREELEKNLLQSKEFQMWGLALTQDEKEADLVLEVHRKRWTTRFTIAALNPHTKHLLASDSDTSLGGEIEPKLAQLFIRQLKKVRPLKAG